MTDGATHGIPASKTVPFMPSLLLRHFRFNIPFLLFRLCPDCVFRFLHIPRAAPEAVLPPFRMPVYPFRMAERCFRCCGRASSDVSYGLSCGVRKALWQYETGSLALRKSLSGCGVGRGRVCRSRHVAFLMT